MDSKARDFAFDETILPIPAVPKAKNSRILEIGLPHKGSGYGTIKPKK